MMPQLWTDTIEAHRAAVGKAIVDTTAALAAKDGVRSLTMSQVAAEVGIGRATLYKYFPDVEAILFAWHERQVAAHLSQLADLARRSGGARDRLRTVLEAYALIQYEHQGTELAALLHRGKHVTDATRALASFIEDLVKDGVGDGDIRNDVGAAEVTRYCLHAITAADGLPSRAAVRRLVKLTMAGLQPPTRTA
jgi:AcrR family transcriptional regulator